MRGTIAAGVFFLSLQSIFAAPVFWTGLMGDGEWGNPENWETRAVPGNGDDVAVESPLTLTIRERVEIESLRLAPGSTLRLESGEAHLNVRGAAIFDGAHLHVNAGGTAIFPGARSFSGDSVADDDIRWTCNGQGSLISFPALTNVAGSRFPFTTRIAANFGGKISFGGEFSHAKGGIELAAAGGEFDLSGLRELRSETLSIVAVNGGRINIPNLREIDGGNYVRGGMNLSSDRSNSVLRISGLKKLVGTPTNALSLSAREGGRLIVEGSFAIEGGGIHLFASGTNSAVDLPGCYGATSPSLTAAAGGGGRILMSNLTSIEATGQMAWTAEGGGRVDLPALTNWTASPFPFRCDVYAENCGFILLGGEFAVGSGAISLRASGTNSVLDAPGLREIASHALEVEADQGASVSLTGLRKVRSSAVQFADFRFAASRENSLLTLSGLEVFSGSRGVWSSRIEALSGGIVEVSGNAVIGDGSVVLHARDRGKLKLPGIRRVASEYFSAEATGAGQIALTNLHELSGAAAITGMNVQAVGRDSGILVSGLTNVAGTPFPRSLSFSCDDGGTVSLSGSFLVNGGGISMAARGSGSHLQATGIGRFATSHSTVAAQNGATITLGIEQWAAVEKNRSFHDWSSAGSNSVLRVEGLLSARGPAHPFSTTFVAAEGGLVELDGRFSILGGNVVFRSYRFGQLHSPGLVSASADRWDAGASEGGLLTFQNLARIDNRMRFSGWYSGGSGSLLAVPGVTEFALDRGDVLFQAENGGELSFGGDFELAGGYASFRVVEPGAVAAFPGLRRLAPTALSASVAWGGRLAFSQLTNYALLNLIGPHHWLAEGRDSLIDAPALLTLAAPRGVFGARFTLLAGSRLNMPSLQSAIGSSLSWMAHGPATTVDLGSLASLDGLPYGNEISAREGAEILLPPVFAFRGTTVDGLAAWGLPPIQSAFTTNDVLLAVPGRAARVEIRPRGDPDWQWESFRRIPVATNRMVIQESFNVPAGFEVRVRELQATRPEIDLYKGEAGKLLLTVFGTPGRSYRIESSPLIEGAPWSESGSIQVNGPFAQTEIAVPAPTRFFRVKE